MGWAALNVRFFIWVGGTMEYNTDVNNILETDLMVFLSSSEKPRSASRIMRTVLLYDHIYGGLHIAFSHGVSQEIIRSLERLVMWDMMVLERPNVYSGVCKYRLTPSGMGLKRLIIENFDNKVLLDGMKQIMAYTHDIDDRALMGMECYYYPQDVAPNLRPLAEQVIKQTYIGGMHVKDVPYDVFEACVKGECSLVKGGHSDDGYIRMRKGKRSHTGMSFRKGL